MLIYITYRICNIIGYVIYTGNNNKEAIIKETIIRRLEMSEGITAINEKIAKESGFRYCDNPAVMFSRTALLQNY